MRVYCKQLLCGVALAATAMATSLFADDRSTEILRYECSNELGRRDVTLFANGTVRLREGLWEDQKLFLDELLREELGSYLAKLRRIQASSEAPAERIAGNSPSGSWVDECRLHVALPESEPVEHRFSAYEVTPLAVSQLIHLAEDLASFTRHPAKVDRIPGDYRPSSGDILRTREGERYRVVALTSDERAVELDAVEAPIRIYVGLDELGEVFAVLEHGDAPAPRTFGSEIPVYDPSQGTPGFFVIEDDEEDDEDSDP